MDNTVTKLSLLSKLNINEVTDGCWWDLGFYGKSIPCFPEPDPTLVLVEGFWYQEYAYSRVSTRDFFHSVGC